METARKLPNLRHLRAFDAVCRIESVNAAAAEINITQPAVTQALSGIETFFETALFVRRADGTYPNEAGRLLEIRVRRFFEQLSSAVSLVFSANMRSDDAIRAVTNRITASQVKALIAIARSASYGGAAKMLGITEPSLHRAARELEQILGRSLFYRSPTGVVVNRLGAEIARRWGLAQLEIDIGFDEVRALGGFFSGRVAIGSLPLARTLILPRAINHTTQIYPRAHFEIIDGPYQTLLRNLREGVLDFLVGALRTPPPFDDIHGDELLWDPYAVVARKDHPLFGKTDVGLVDLAGFDWVIAREGTLIRSAFEALFADGPRPLANIETSSLIATRGLLMESDRLTLLSERQIAIDEQAELLKVLPFPLPHTTRSIGVTTRRDWLPSAVHKCFLQCLHQAAREA
ncbi:MAG TPA: LysR family transcriptional regulator [Rhizobiaceae bacterium]|nr:LysR family transcriptional regulator [Rhizobiaceae bacterium]